MGRRARSVLGRIPVLITQGHEDETDGHHAQHRGAEVEESRSGHMQHLGAIGQALLHVQSEDLGDGQVAKAVVSNQKLIIVLRIVAGASRKANSSPVLETSTSPAVKTM